MMKKILIPLFLTLLMAATVQAQVTTVATLPGGLPIGTALKGTDLYVSAYGQSKIVKIDLTQPFPVTPTTVLSNISNPTGLTVIGDYLYFNTEGNIPGLPGARSARINLTIPSPTIEQVMTNTLDDAQAYARIGDTLYISSANNGIFRVNLSQPLPQMGVQISTQKASGIALRGNELYYGLYNSDKVSKINRHQPNPTPVVVVTGLAGPDGLTFSGNFLYVSESTGSRIVKFDVTQPNPTVETVANGLAGPTLTVFDELDIYFGQSGNGNVSRLSINALSFSPPAVVCANDPAALRTGGSPLGGIYSGPHVTNSGNGETFSFNGQAAGPGTHTITYTFGALTANATLTVTAAPVIGVFGFLTAVNTPPSLLPDPSAGPAGGVYSGPGVLAGNIFDAALAGVGVHVITYTFTDANGCTGTGTGTITVNQAAILPADGCADASDINNLFGGAYNVPQTSDLQDNTGYTATGDPTVANGCFYQNDPVQRSIWYSFTGDGKTYRLRSVQCSATNYIPDGDTQVAIFTGSCGSPTQVACNDDENGNASILNFSVDLATVAGENYRVLVDGYGGLQGEFCLEVTNLTQPTTPITFTLGTTCSNVTATLGGATPTGGVYSGPGVTNSGNGSTFSFNPMAAGGPGAYTVTYTLPNGSSATTPLTVTAAPVIGVFGFLTDVATPPSLLPDPSAGPAGGVYSGPGVLAGNIFDAALAGVGVHVITYTFTDANGCTGTGTGTITVNQAAILPADGCADASDINNLFGGAYNVPQTSGLQDNTGYTNTGDPAVSTGCFYQNDPVQRSIWYSFTGDGNTYRIRSVQCSATNYIPDGDTQVAIFTGSCGSPTQVACNDDENANASILNFSLDIATQSGQTYRVLVDGFGGIQGEFCLEVTNLSPSAVIDISQTDIRLFPNPTTGTVQLMGVDADQVQVFDNLSRLILQIVRPGNSVDMSGVPAGMYFLKIAKGEAVYSARVVKE